MTFQWNAATQILLAEKWNSGCPASEIARQFGGGLTRNAVIGKITRLRNAGWKLRASKISIWGLRQASRSTRGPLE